MECFTHVVDGKTNRDIVKTLRLEIPSEFLHNGEDHRAELIIIIWVGIGQLDAVLWIVCKSI